MLAAASQEPSGSDLQHLWGQVCSPICKWLASGWVPILKRLHLTHFLTSPHCLAHLLAPAVLAMVVLRG